MLRTIVSFILLIVLLVLAGCASPMNEEVITRYIKQYGAADANLRFEKMYNQKIDSLKEGRWELDTTADGKKYVSYISPLVKQGNKEVYMVLEYSVGDKKPLVFLCYKFFNKGEDYTSNHH